MLLSRDDDHGIVLVSVGGGRYASKVSSISLEVYIYICIIYIYIFIIIYIYIIFLNIYIYMYMVPPPRPTFPAKSSGIYSVFLNILDSTI